MHNSCRQYEVKYLTHQTNPWSFDDPSWLLTNIKFCYERHTNRNRYTKEKNLQHLEKYTTSNDAQKDRKVQWIEVGFVAILLKKQNLKHSPNVRNKNNLDEIHNRNDKHHIIYTDFYRLCNLSNFTEKKMTRAKNV